MVTTLIYFFADASQRSSPINPSSSMQNFWHGNVETSTDTLVPVVESNVKDDSIIISPTSIDDITVLPKSTDQLNGSSAVTRNGDLKPRILPEVHCGTKPKSSWQLSNYGNGHSVDDSIVIQPEHQRMNITNGSNARFDNGVGSNGVNPTSGSTSGFTAAPSSLYRRRKNSSNSRQSPLDMVSPNNGHTGRSANGR